MLIPSKSIIDCIQTKEFMHVYNAIVVLKEILDVFPLASVGEAGVGIHAAVERLVETETRGDLKILARSLVFLPFLPSSQLLTDNNTATWQA